MFTVCLLLFILPLPLSQDLSLLGRDLTKVVIINNSPQSYIFHPDNAVSLVCVRVNMCVYVCANLVVTAAILTDVFFRSLFSPSLEGSCHILV